MDKISKVFLEQVQGLQKYLADLLEKEPLQKNQKAELAKPFAVSSDLSQIGNVLRVGLPWDLKSRMEILFERLSPYFEAGLLFQRQELPAEQWVTLAGFDQGRFYALKNVDLQIPFRFPPLTLVEVQKVHSKELFDQLQQIRVAKTASSQVLIFKPHPDYLFLVSSELPDLWLKPHIEKVQKELLLILGDEVD